MTAKPTKLTQAVYGMGAGAAFFLLVAAVVAAPPAVLYWVAAALAAFGAMSACRAAMRDIRKAADDRHQKVMHELWEIRRDISQKGFHL